MDGERDKQLLSVFMYVLFSGRQKYGQNYRCNAGISG